MDDRDALRELLTGYARAVDARDFDRAAALFTPEGRLTVRGRQSRGRAEIRDTLTRLERYDRTQHDVGGSTIETNGDSAVGQTHCVAHHVDVMGDRVLVLRYVDAFVRVDGAWLIAHRQLLIDSEEVHPE
jgi:uncharacterized protein (TIGR02246 family)